MDLPMLTEVRLPASRADLALSATVAPLAGGTWLYSEPQPHLTGLVDLTALRWTPWEARSDGGLSIAATCTIAQLVAIPASPGSTGSTASPGSPGSPGSTGSPDWRAVRLFRQSAESLLQSFKVWNTATVGGNIATALAAGAIIGLGGVLDAELVIWTPDGGERRERVADFVVGQRATTIRAGEVVRSIEVDPGPLGAATTFRRIALSPLGRAGTVVHGRRDADGALVVCVTGGTVRPEVVRFPSLPSPTALREAVGGLTSWFTDAHGAADWRRAVSQRFAEEIRQELA